MASLWKFYIQHFFLAYMPLTINVYIQNMDESKTVHIDLTHNTNLKPGTKNMITDTTLLYHPIKLIISF